MCSCMRQTTNKCGTIETMQEDPVCMLNHQSHVNLGISCPQAVAANQTDSHAPYRLLVDKGGVDFVSPFPHVLAIAAGLLVRVEDYVE